MRMHNKSIFKFFFTIIFIFGFFLSSLTINVNPVFAAECTEGQEVLGSGCECSPPRGYPYHETNNSGSSNPQRFCVNRCTTGQDVFNASGVPTCFCAGDADMIINEAGTCVSNEPDCETGAAIENCSCYLPRRSVTRTGASTAYCVATCSDGQRTTNDAGNPACSCDFRNVSGFCVRDCTNNQLAYNDAGTPMCFCPTTTEENRCILEDEGGAGGDGQSPLGPGKEGVTSSDFDAFNPLKIGQNSTGGTGSNLATDLSTPGGIISRLLDFAFPLAGLILFVMLVWGGFEMVYGANNTSKAIEAGKNRITTALIGFILLFASYWIMQLVEVILGITIF